MHPLQRWSKGLCFPCFLLLWEHLASLLDSEMWAHQTEKTEKKELTAAWEVYRIYQYIEQLCCHTSERK